MALAITHRHSGLLARIECDKLAVGRLSILVPNYARFASSTLGREFVTSDRGRIGVLSHPRCRGAGSKSGSRYVYYQLGLDGRAALRQGARLRAGYSDFFTASQGWCRRDSRVDHSCLRVLLPRHFSDDENVRDVRLTGKPEANRSAERVGEKSQLSSR